MIVVADLISFFNDIVNLFGDIFDVFYMVFLTLFNTLLSIFDTFYVPLSAIINGVFDLIQLLIDFYLQVFGFLGDAWLLLFTVLFLLYASFIVLAIFKALIAFVSSILHLIPLY